MVPLTDLRRKGGPPLRAVHRICHIFSLNVPLTFRSKHDAFQERKVQSAGSDGPVSKMPNAYSIYIENPLPFVDILTRLVLIFIVCVSEGNSDVWHPVVLAGVRLLGVSSRRR